MKYKVLVPIILSIVLALLSGCSTTVPEDALDVTWTSNMFSFLKGQNPSFNYNGTDYILLDLESCWNVSKIDMRYLGMILSGGTNAIEEPHVLFGLPIASAYRRAYGYFNDTSENPLVIYLAPYTIWLDSSIDLSPENEQLFLSYEIRVNGTECKSAQSDSVAGLSYCDIIQNGFVVDEKEFDNGERFCCIHFYLKDYPCLYYYVWIYEHEGYYYAPASISLPEWKREKYVRLNDEWQAIISSTLLPEKSS